MAEQYVMGRFERFDAPPMHYGGCLQCGGSGADLKRRIQELEQRVKDLEADRG